jgi:hypothetical protein
MSHQPNTVDLGRLDTPTFCPLDPGIWQANFAALAAEQPALADTLANTPLPDHWRSATALDGFVTFRIEPPGQPPAWLGDTAAPLTRAAGVLAGYQPGDGNPTLPALTAGAELRLLLDQLPDYRAVYVFETEPLILAAVLHAQDFSHAITTGRCILVPPGRAQEFLQEHLNRHPGLLPPGNIACPPQVSSARLNELRGTCEQIGRWTQQVRTERLAALAAAPPTAIPGTRLRAAIVALTPDPDCRPAAEALLRAAGNLDWATADCVLRGPRDVHALRHAETLAPFTPDLSLCLNQSRARLPLPPGGTVCEWYTRAAAIPATLPDDDVLRLAASPHVYATLRQRAPSAARIAEWWWGCEPWEADPTPPTPDTVVLVADLPSPDATHWGISQPSHKQLWRGLRELCERLWETRDIHQPQALLSRAERACDVRVGEPQVRELLLHALEHALIPHAVLTKITQTLGPTVRLLTVGTGWQRWPAKEIEQFAPSIHALATDEQRPRPLAAIFAGALDPLRPGLLQAAILGWPLLLHAPGGHSLTTALGGLLHPQQHYHAFSGAKDLLALMQTLRRNPEQAGRVAVRARELLAAQHTYTHRMHALRELVKCH